MAHTQAAVAVAAAAAACACLVLTRRPLLCITLTWLRTRRVCFRMHVPASLPPAAAATDCCYCCYPATAALCLFPVLPHAAPNNGQKIMGVEPVQLGAVRVRTVEGTAGVRGLYLLFLYLISSFLTTFPFT